MTRERKIEILRAKMEDVDPDESIDPVILGYYLDDAGAIILNKLYQFSDQVAGMEVPARYEGLQIRISHYMLNKRGAEGEIQHIENGIHRNYGASDIPEQMLKEITPFVQIL